MKFPCVKNIIIPITALLFVHLYYKFLSFKNKINIIKILNSRNDIVRIFLPGSSALIAYQFGLISSLYYNSKYYDILKDNHSLKIDGYSSGAVCSLLMAILFKSEHLCPDDVFSEVLHPIYDKFCNTYSHLFDMEFVIQKADELMAKSKINHDELDFPRVGIYATRIEEYEIYNEKFTNFKSFDEIKDIISFAIHIPYVTDKSLYKTHNGVKYADGYIGDCLEAILQEPTKKTLLILNNPYEWEYDEQFRNTCCIDENLTIMNGNVLKHLGKTEESSMISKSLPYMFTVNNSKFLYTKGIEDSVANQAQFDRYIKLVLCL